MEVLINAGGKGTRMGACGIEKPMQIIGGKPTVGRVVDAMLESKYVDRILVSVSPNTVKTEEYLIDRGIDVIRTSGEDFMMDMRESFKAMNGKYVMVCPSDVPLITSDRIDFCASRFEPAMQSMVVMVSAELVRSLGIVPSYACEVEGKEYVLSGLSIMDREATIAGDYLGEFRLMADFKELAVNVNTPGELELARKMC